MDNQYGRALLEKYKNGLATDVESALVEDWISYGVFPEYKISMAELDQELSAMEKQLPLVKERNLWPRIAAAAAILLIFGTGLFYYFDTIRNAGMLASKVEKWNKITPGGNRATLILTNGKAINLSNAKKGVVIDVSAGSTSLTYNDGSKVQDSSSGDPSLYSKNNNEFSKIMELSTPRGGTYQLILPDGTKVWLNAVSSIQFPATFAGLKQRIIQLTGEAYFEVTKNKKMPFVVKTSKQEVTVLGTHFNINSYNDEPATKTTLLEGAIQVSRYGKQEFKTLKPGQMSTVDKEIVIGNANLNQAVAWKEGNFMFKNESLESIMRQVARWYDVEVIYQDDLRAKTFWGTINRFSRIAEVLEILELTGKVHFKIEGRRVTVMK